MLLSRLLSPWDSPGKNTRVGCHDLLQGIFHTQGSNLHLLHCQADSLLLSHLGSLSFTLLTCKCRRQWQPTPVLLPGKSHGWRSLVGYSPWGREELDMTEQLHFHFSLSCIGEENGNPLQCSFLENSRDRGAWCAAVYGVAQNQTRLKRLSRVNVFYILYAYICGNIYW